MHCFSSFKFTKFNLRKPRKICTQGQQMYRFTLHIYIYNFSPGGGVLLSADS